MIGEIFEKHGKIMNSIQPDNPHNQNNVYHTKGASVIEIQFNAVIQFFKAFISKLISINLITAPTKHQSFFVIQIDTEISILLDKYQLLINKYFDLIDDLNTNRYFIYFSYLLYFTFRTSPTVRYNKNEVESYFTIPNNEFNKLLNELTKINEGLKRTSRKNFHGDFIKLIKDKINNLKKFIIIYKELSEDDLKKFIDMYIETIPSCKKYEFPTSKKLIPNYFSASGEYKDCLKYKVYYWKTLKDFLSNVDNLGSIIQTVTNVYEKHKNKFVKISKISINSINSKLNTEFKINNKSNNKNLNKIKYEAFTNHITE